MARGGEEVVEEEDVEEDVEGNLYGGSEETAVAKKE